MLATLFPNRLPLVSAIVCVCVRARVFSFGVGSQNEVNCLPANEPPMTGSRESGEKAGVDSRSMIWQCASKFVGTSVSAPVYLKVKTLIPDSFMHYIKFNNIG